MKRRKFIQVTGSSGLLIGSTGTMFAFDSLPTSVSEENLKQQAIKAFNRFEKVWDFNDFWKRGNTFDACLTFVDALQHRWSKDTEVKAVQKRVGKMLKENIDFFNSYDPGTLWADDFGWWGLMALNARKHLLRIGDKELADKYLKLSTDLCWEYKKKTAYDHNDVAKPVAHGCRNGDANGDSLGVKNTVTNVLLFLLSSRIYRLAKSEDRKDIDKYLDMAYRQWVWFNEWFELKEYKYLKKLSTEGALVQERPIAMFEGSGYTEKIHPPWAEGWVWSGDQGMLVAALSDMIAVKDDVAVFVAKKNLDPDFDVHSFEKEARKIVQSIGRGVKNALVADIDGIIREAPCSSSFGPAHARDYLAGRGILMRYLGSKEEKSLLGVNMDKAVLNTVQAIWETRDKTNNQFQPEYTLEVNDKQYVEQFRKQWGLADNVHRWDLKMEVQNKHGVCQAVGMDLLGAAIRTL